MRPGELFCVFVFKYHLRTLSLDPAEELTYPSDGEEVLRRLEERLSVKPPVNRTVAQRLDDINKRLVKDKQLKPISDPEFGRELQAWCLSNPTVEEIQDRIAVVAEALILPDLELLVFPEDFVSILSLPRQQQPFQDLLQSPEVPLYQLQGYLNVTCQAQPYGERHCEDIDHLIDPLLPDFGQDGQRNQWQSEPPTDLPKAMDLSTISLQGSDYMAAADEEEHSGNYDCQSDTSHAGTSLAGDDEVQGLPPGAGHAWRSARRAPQMADHEPTPG
ncbi:hypothetical protein FALBO_11803 [Fusarium albosuccineum]|uniref:Uncharacterized protein n=1 Tax=Fusarium albosuccineum TaxID=1237068 RepID=A0A8H4P9R7_9HYPO|nr:hypothetical protein FALBO_11803 [Fusarium albosuccineum]